MTLSEAKSRFEQGKSVWSALDFGQWATGKHRPYSIAPTGEKFIVMSSSGEKPEGEEFSKYYETEEWAILAWLSAVSGMAWQLEKPTVYWRIEPEVEKIPDKGYVVYSRLVVSEKPVLQS